MRILGKVSLTVQCIHDGVSSGTFHVKGNVVLDLAKNFDCDAISGSKMRSLLLNGRSSPSSLSSPSRSTSPSSTSTPPARPSAQSSTARPSAQSSTARPSAQSSTARTSAPPSSQGRTSPNPSPSSPRTPKNSNSAASGSELFHEVSTRSEKSDITAVRSRKYDTASARSTPSRASSPPGFPATPQYRQYQVSSPHHPVHNLPHIPVSLVHSDYGQITQMSPLTTNLRMLSNVFHDADVKPDLIKERRALFDSDVDGDIEVDNDGKNTFYLTEGYIYQSGHGREKCSMAKCLNLKEAVPNNCGFHEQFLFHTWFEPCGEHCQGGFCKCLKDYDY